MFILYPELYPWLCLPQSLINILANMPCIGCISCIANFAIKMLAEFVQKNPNTKIAKYLKIRDCSNTQNTSYCQRGGDESDSWHKSRHN